MVSPRRRSTVCCNTRCSPMLVRSTTSPSGVTTAENPVGAAWTTQRPVSMARRRDEATCWVWTWVNQYDEPLVGFNNTSPPPAMPSRARPVKNTSHEIATPTGPAGVANTAGEVPALASRRGRPAPGATRSMNDRNGTHSPKGTRNTLS